MKILVINCGSSSIKYQLFQIDSNYNLMAKGMAERIGLDGAQISHTPTGKEKITIQKNLPDHRSAMETIEQMLTDPNYGVIKNIAEIQAIGHRVVHGGEKFTGSVLIDDNVIQAITDNCDLAPLHNPPNITGIETAAQLLPKTPNVAVFDTAVHQTMPKKAFLYGLPIEFYEKHHIRKYGFHGTSHGYVAKQAAKLMNKPFEQSKIITVHIGNGGSITAFKNGKSIDTSMGLTPLEGIVMGTRCGDIDPAVVMHLMEIQKLSLKEVNDILNKKSGLLGLCGKSDMRDIFELISKGDNKAKDALEVFKYRITKYIGAYTAALGGVEAIVFTAGIGENNPALIADILSQFEYLGLKIDKDKSTKNANIFSADDSKVFAMMIPTNEELVIARETYDIVKTLN